MPRKAQHPQFDPIDKPITVFLGSDQDEFQQIREDLKSDIEDITLKYAKPFKAVLIERRRGTNIDRDIEEGQKEEDIHILLVGGQFSSITREEFLKACRMGLKVYVYFFLKRRVISPKLKQNANYDFVHKDIKPRFRIRGYDKPYRVYEQLFDDISADLASGVVEMVHESAAVRRVIGS
jgi:hypothetical protein